MSTILDANESLKKKSSWRFEEDDAAYYMCPSCDYVTDDCDCCCPECEEADMVVTTIHEGDKCEMCEQEFLCYEDGYVPRDIKYSAYILCKECYNKLED